MLTQSDALAHLKESQDTALALCPATGFQESRSLHLPPCTGGAAAGGAVMTNRDKIPGKFGGQKICLEA